MSFVDSEFHIVLKNLRSPAQPLISLARNKHLNASALSSTNALVHTARISSSLIFLEAHARKNISTTECRDVECVTAPLAVCASFCLDAFTNFEGDSMCNIFLQDTQGVAYQRVYIAVGVLQIKDLFNGRDYSSNLQVEVWVVAVTLPYVDNIFNRCRGLL